MDTNTMLKIPMQFFAEDPEGTEPTGKEKAKLFGWDKEEDE